MNLTRDNVTYYSLNGSGEIDRLILDDATGDAGQFGVLIRMETMGDGSSLYSYEYDLGGSVYTLPASTTRFPVAWAASAWWATPPTPTGCTPSTR